MRPVKRTLDYFRAKKYKAIQKRLAYVESKAKGKKFLVIQVDSVSHDILNKAMRRGFAPTIRRLIRKKGYRLQPYYSGIPANTPASLAKILYGTNGDIPGFRYIDKKQKQEYTFDNAKKTLLVEQNILPKTGVLKGGSSYGNTFSGGAQHCVLTMSTLLQKKLFKQVKDLDILFFLLINPISLLRVISFTFFELTLEFSESIYYGTKALFSKKLTADKNIFFPIVRIAMNVLLREIETHGTILDIQRKVPRVYVNFLGYDEIAHHRGPNNLSAYLTLRGIDRRIAKILRHLPEDYELHILSDHGNTKSIPFKDLYGKSLGEYIQEITKENVELVDFESAELQVNHRVHAIRTKLANTLKIATLPARIMIKAGLWSLSKNYRTKRKTFKWKNKEQIFVENGSSLSNIYFNISKNKLTVKEISKKYPMLLTILSKHPAIGVLIGHTKTNPVIISHGKSLPLTQNPSNQVKKILSRYGNPIQLAKDTYALAKMPLVGDLIIYAGFVNNEQVAFANQYAAHGAPGGNATSPFYVGKTKKKISIHQDIHKLLKN
ncbi:hypothetical protein GOV04_04835 [Candidatus Woesearchaeota archaeon]|nr:hypothetical protein [Candidatus Woesearchaeota archaeon]